MTLRTRLLGLLLFLVVIAAYCRALTFKAISLDEVEAALVSHHPEQLDEEFADYLAANYEAPERHGVLARTYHNLFEPSTARVREAVERWVAGDPESPHALAAHGMHYESVGEDARWRRICTADAASQFPEHGQVDG